MGKDNADCDDMPEQIAELTVKLQSREGECAAKAQIIAQLEAERDEARAQVAAAFEAAAHLIECDGDALGGKSGAAKAIRALTPSNAQAALEAYGREKVPEGMQRVIDRLRHEGQINPSLTYSDAIEWTEYVLNEMEMLK